ncbi:MAG: hypothetical protein QM754_20390 [Tepidisphaeraceae bacterium]
MEFSPFRPGGRQHDEQGTTHIMRHRAFARLLAFAGLTIDDVVNNPVAKRAVYNWFKTDRRLHRRLEVLELEKQWNPLG